MSYKITFQFEDKNLQPIEVSCSKGETILDVALDNDVHLHHNCGAVCACSTCHVYIKSGMESLPEITEKEEDFIDRAINPTLNSRLACQCKISDDVVVTIPDQSQFNGH
ncbi:MAG: 2Fe-2S iron-sulfur cluster binding domain-containing protein [Flavobacteriales bacterium]|nr:2Fe-2S iron-sulfur cluster binding domain-containing protein [Flavobacteriales bacterium]